MLFNSIEFLIFLPIVFFLYWFVVNQKLKYQNILVLLSSYFFYGWWDWRFLFLILFSSVVDFIIGHKLNTFTKANKRKLLLITSILINVSLLGFFKYYNFFVDSFNEAFTFFGKSLNDRSLNIVLPVGISFYTFQTMSYTIDIYRRKIEPSKDIIAFFAFVCFFPQLVAGPIERASNLLPQFFKKRKFQYEKAVDGLRQMLWGLFKKVVVADNLSKIVEPIYDNVNEVSSITLLVGLALFSVQIYADFSGYSDIAIGTSRLFGFDLKINFKYPLFARSIGERWRNWHISLSTWFRDYIYIPMGGSKGNNWSKFKNVLFLFLISGFWHGANWTFIFWGLVNGLFFLPSMLFGMNRRFLVPIDKNKFLPSLKEFFQIITTFWMIALTYIFFRADNIQHSKAYFLGLLNNHNLQIIPDSLLTEYGLSFAELLRAAIFIVMMLLIEWIHRDKPHGLSFNTDWNRPKLKWALYFAIVFIIIWWGGDQETFIYFQF